MFGGLFAHGFQVTFPLHAKAILGGDFPEVAEQLEATLLGVSIPIEEIVGSGGGEAKETQWLRCALFNQGWRKRSLDRLSRSWPVATLPLAF